MLRRFLALAFGVVVIAGAISIRNNNDRGADPGTVAEVDPYQVFEDHEVSVLCAEELVILCERLESFVTSTRVEPAWQTVDRLAAGDDLGADAWLTFRALAEISSPPGPSPGQAPLRASEPVARTTVALAGPPAALAAVEQACPDTRTLLSCAGTAKVAQVMLRDPALDAAEDQREVIRRLDAVVREARVRLVLVNGRLDEAVGRAVETAGRAGRADRGHEGGTDLGAGELAGDLRALREALEEVASPGHDRRPVAPPQDQPRRATSAD